MCWTAHFAGWLLPRLFLRRRAFAAMLAGIFKKLRGIGALGPFRLLRKMSGSSVDGLGLPPEALKTMFGNSGVARCVWDRPWPR
jgi:hypothetical protein